jgi:hypothetical protein
LFHQFARIPRVGVARDNNVLSIDGRLVRIITLAAIVVLETLLVDEVFGLVFLKNLFLGLVVVAAGRTQLAWRFNFEVWSKLQRNTNLQGSRRSSLRGKLLRVATSVVAVVRHFELQGRESRGSKREKPWARDRCEDIRDAKKAENLPPH